MGPGMKQTRCLSTEIRSADVLSLLLKSPAQTSKASPRSPEPGEAAGSPQERGLLYKPQLQSVRDRVRYIERAHSR